MLIVRSVQPAAGALGKGQKWLLLPLLLLAGAGQRELGLPFGETRERVRAMLSAAGIECKPAGENALQCPRAPEKVPGAAGLRLEFENEKLQRAELSIDPGAKTWPALRARYVELKRELTQKHGEPKASLEYVDRFYVLADEEYKAIADGKGEFTSTWRVGELGVKLSLRGEKRQVRLTLSYGPKEDVLH